MHTSNRFRCFENVAKLLVLFLSCSLSAAGAAADAPEIAAASPTAFSGETEIAKWDPRMAADNAVVDTNGVKWIDGRYLPLEGRAFDDTEFYYDRLPANVTTNVNEGVRGMKHHTSGMMFRFKTDSKTLKFRWKPCNKELAMHHMPATGKSGIDVYRYDAAKGRWFHVRTGYITDADKGGSLNMNWTPGEPCLVNLPLYNGIREFTLGIATNATVGALPPRKSGVSKPVVFYGTSITHGGCCSRPGLSFVNWIGRDLDVPVVGLGFSGSGAMEFEMSEHLARIDASCYVLDCLWNMGTKARPYLGRCVDERYEPFIRNLRAKRPDVPIVMAEQCDVFCGGANEKDLIMRRLYEKLVAEGWKNLVYLPKDEMYTGDGEGTVDTCHPNDLGMQSMKNAFGKAVREALHLQEALPDVGRPDVTLPRTEFDRYFAELDAADRTADAAWGAVGSKDALLARRAELRNKFVRAVGAFPDRTPLNAQVVATVPREGYRVEKVLFESRPYFHVPALVYVPDAARFAPPYPAVLITCGHSADGKASAGYQRACVMGANEGFLMMVYDPIDQGERLMSTAGSCCSGHNQFGSKAHVLGLSAAHFRIWDGIRCLDYLQSRPDVKGDRLGLMGNSGGGTMTTLISAVDGRVKAASPSCYISTIRDVVSAIGPQDAEQCVWGQLEDGINHASLVLMADAAVRLQFSDRDFFPIAGACSTFDVVKRTADRVGLGDRYSATVVKGPHGWKESSRRSSLDWMRQWLMDEPPNGKTDADYVALDAGFDANKADMGLSEAEASVTPERSVLKLPGERTVSDFLVDAAIGPKTPRLVFRETEPPRHSFYGAKSAAEENAVVALMLGRNLADDRKAEILAQARDLASRGEPKPVLVAEDGWILPAERAFAEAPELFAGFRPLGDGTFQTAVRNK